VNWAVIIIIIKLLLLIDSLILIFRKRKRYVAPFSRMAPSSLSSLLSSQSMSSARGL